MSDELNTQVQPTQEPTSAPEPKPETEKEVNLRILRERAEQAERRAAELELAMKQNMEQKQTTKMELVDDDITFDDDSLIEGKHLKRIYNKQKEELKQIKQMLKESSVQSESASAEWRLKTQYTDFDAVVNEDNIKKLAASKPALYRSMLANPNLYEKGETAYELIKNLVLSEKYAAQDKRIEENRSKPRSAGSIAPQSADTPLAHISDYDRRSLSEERKAQLRSFNDQAKRQY